MALVGTALALLVLQNLLLQVALRPLLNRRPERLRVDYTTAWMVIPGQVTVRGLSLRGQGLLDQWRITADRASGTIDLGQLLDRSFYACDLRAHGVSVRYRRRVDPSAPAPPDATQTGPARVEVSNDPPIEGLYNPPDPAPEAIYPQRAEPWRIRLDDIEADAVRELWIGDYHLTGPARVTASVSLARPFMDIDATLALDGMQVAIGDTPVAGAVDGVVSLLIDSVNRQDPLVDQVQAIHARAQIRADVQDLRFLDFYLAAVPWLSLTGAGPARLDVQLSEGAFHTGSSFAAYFPELIVRIVGDDVIGAGTLRAEISAGPDGVPRSRLAVDFDDFSIVSDGSTDALVEGTGFHLGAMSPDIALDRPLSLVEVEVDLPESRIPDLTLYNTYLPVDAGLSLAQGTGTVRGHFVASSLDSHASGDLYLTADELVARRDALMVTGDLAVHARLADADLLAGRYDLSGSSVELARAGLVARGSGRAQRGQGRWSASISVVQGVILVGAPVYLDTTVSMRCSDSDPLVAVFAAQKDLPRWVQDLLSVPRVSGVARVRLGRTSVQVDRCTIRGGAYRIDLRYSSVGTAARGELLAQSGPLSVGIALRPAGPELQLFGAKRWFEGKGRASAGR